MDIHWFESLSTDERDLLKRFLLTSGSLKHLAELYQITYPTIRIRVDRLIEKVKAIDEARASSSFEKSLKKLHTEGKLDSATYDCILTAHKNDKEFR